MLHSCDATLGMGIILIITPATDADVVLDFPCAPFICCLNTSDRGATRKDQKYGIEFHAQ